MSKGIFPYLIDVRIELECWNGRLYSAPSAGSDDKKLFNDAVINAMSFNIRVD